MSILSSLSNRLSTLLSEPEKRSASTSASFDRAVSEAANEKLAGQAQQSEPARAQMRAASPPSNLPPHQSGGQNDPATQSALASKYGIAARDHATSAPAPSKAQTARSSDKTSSGATKQSYSRDEFINFMEDYGWGDMTRISGFGPNGQSDGSDKQDKQG